MDEKSKVFLERLQSKQNSVVFNDNKLKLNLNANKVKTYFISPKIENLNKEKNPEFYNILINQFDNPNEYLKEDNTEAKVIIGKKPMKEPFSSAVKKYELKISKKPSQNSINIYTSRKQSQFKVVLPNSNKHVLSLKISKFDEITNLESNTNSNYCKPNHNQNATSSTMQVGNYKNTRDYIDNNGINNLVNQIKRRKDQNEISNIFENIVNIESKDKIKATIQNKAQLMDIFNKQEQKLSCMLKQELEFDMMSKKISNQSHKKESNLLMEKSSRQHRNKIELNNLIEKTKAIKHGYSTMDWQMNLRHNKKNNLDFKTYSLIKVGNNNPIFATVTDNSSQIEIIRKPKLAINLTLPKLVADERDEMEEELSDRQNVNMKASSIFNKTKFSTNLNNYLKTTKSLWTTFNKNNEKYNHTFSTIGTKLHYDNNDLFLKGDSLLLIEKELALDIKGRKYLLNINEKGKDLEEMLKFDYDRIIS